MSDAVPEPVFPEDDPYPAYRVLLPPIELEPKRRTAIDQYVLSAVIATGTVLVDERITRRISGL
jgi:hypothetical protein